MFMRFAFAIFAGGVLAFFALPDQEAGFRMLSFSTAFLILSLAAVCVIAFLTRKLGRYRLRSSLQPSRCDDDLPLHDAAKFERSAWSTSGVNSKDPNLIWQYCLNDRRLGRFKL
ncbi:MAG: hypothetical protein EOS31_12005 [Mesorhizobium sp.]|uniref:hypothetical protein n=1 Tax=unclassified Mesorhizobium TaxID=325217 RepID=UPI000FCA7864|nr:MULTISPECIES: hypothetical protein [unclassified Mesorhizobium]RVC87498.1 hypothetical protein EN739_34245 [Mesorhizobium sp. M2A.F.Ca.ET.017.03.2.1]RVC93859.1 hypothetical protein EN753_33470 [Mesorhizobium sp. M2A.F.Ca.ET.029.05.1.1]RWC83323.1 MAG: hypothetical protein EOS31_12005 [Mesorhizobium sp.]RWF56185.1 MAG: hypothetical protein EOS66_11685 [Mesorhizobium sp.]